MYNVVNSIITDRKMYRCIFKVSFYFKGSLYEINVLLTLFLQIEVSIVMVYLERIKSGLTYVMIGTIMLLYRSSFAFQPNFEVFLLIMWNTLMAFPLTFSMC